MDAIQENCLLLSGHNLIGRAGAQQHSRDGIHHIINNIAGDGAGGSVTGTMRADYQIFVSGSQAPGTYTGIVKYIIAVNP